MSKVSAIIFLIVVVKAIYLPLGGLPAEKIYPLLQPAGKKARRLQVQLQGTSGCLCVETAMFSLCLHEVSPGALASSHSLKTCAFSKVATMNHC